MEPLTLKTSTIYIAIGARTEVYRSMEEVPAELAERISRTTRAGNSATILIADRGGREEISRAMRGLPSRLRSRRVTAQAGNRAVVDSGRRYRLTLKQSLALLGVATIGFLALVLWSIR